MDQQSAFDKLVAEGLAAGQAGRPEEALALFVRAGEMAPASGVPPFLIASEQAAAGNVDAAEAAFASAVLLAPEFLLARYQLGLLQFSSGRPAVGLLTWEPLLTAPASEPLGHYVRGFASLAQDDLPTALLHLREGLALPDGNPAVSADIRRVIASVEALSTTGEASKKAAPAQASHVLLGAYSGALH